MDLRSISCNPILGYTGLLSTYTSSKIQFIEPVCAWTTYHIRKIARCARHVSHARALMHIDMACQRYQRKRYRHSRPMCNSQFCLSCKRPIGRRTVVLAILIYDIFLNCLNLIWPDLANVVIFIKRLVSTYVFYLPLYAKYGHNIFLDCAAHRP